ncbi:MAG: Chromosome partition protein Smc [Kerstersia gyiorum]|uniref:host specificity factor TipJ family phage tail protein n=1 Tax=Kerstersia gyiorum TaxID=206506 RepID=UPI0030D169F6
MPNITICRNPFRPQLDREVAPIRTGTRLDTVLRQQGLVSGRGRKMTRTHVFVVNVNGEWLTQDKWARRVERDDVVLAAILPAGGGGSNPLQIVAMVALAAATAGIGSVAMGAAAGLGTFGAAAVGGLAAAGVAIAGGMLLSALFPPAKTPSTMAREQASPTYTIGAQGNMARLMESIPVQYGRYRAYPDFASQPYTELDGNQTYLYQLFCLGQGEYDIEEIRIEDTPIGSFEEVQYEVIQPGGKVTLFPDNVVSSETVSSIELKGPNEDNYAVVGPFVANPAGTQANQIAIDIVFPAGLYYANDRGGMDRRSVSWSVAAEEIDDQGNVIGGEISLGSETYENNTNQAQMMTYRYSVPAGRYRVKVWRTSNKDTDSRCANLIQWGGMRAYLPDHREYGNVTLIAMIIRATNNLNQSTARRVNVIATRKLKTWDPVNGWSAGTVSTKNPAWALADACKNSEYGRGLPDSRINLAGLHRLAQIWEQRGDHYNGVFDTATTLWDALKRIARVGRAMPMYYAGVIDFIRNEPKTVKTQMFTPASIVSKTFNIDYAFPEHDSPDHVIVEFTNEETWQPDEVTCALPGSAKLRPYRLQIPGITKHDHAWREGIALAAQHRDQRRFVSFQTEMAGLIPRYSDLVEISHDVPAWGLTGYIEEYDPDTKAFVTSEPLQWWEGQNHYVNLRRRDGSPDGPYRVVKGSHDREMRIADTVDGHEIFVSDGQGEAFTHYQFGPGERRSLLAQVMSATPDENKRVSLDFVNYAPSVHTAENGEAPPPNPVSLLPANPNAPIVDNVTVYASPVIGQQVVSATPARGAERYEFRASNDDGATWVDLGAHLSSSITTTLQSGQWRVQARGIGTLQGPWATWNGMVSATLTPPPELLALQATSQVMAIQLDWTLPSAPWIRSVEIWYSSTNNFLDASLLGEFRSSQLSHTLTGLSLSAEFWFWARIRDDADQAGPWFPSNTEAGVRGTTSADPGPILEVIGDQVLSSTWGQQMAERVEDIDYRMLDIRAEVGATDELIEKTRRQVRDQGRVLDNHSRDLQQQADQLVENIQAIEAEAQARETGLQQQADALAAESRDRIQKQQQQAADIAVNTAAISAEIANRVDAVDALRQETDGRFSAMQAEMSEILGTEDYQPEQAYLAGALVKYLGKLYRAQQDIPAGVAPPDARWELIGDYESMGAAVADLSSRMVSVEVLTETQTLRIESVETRAGQNTSKIDGLRETVDGQSTVLLGLRTDVDGNTSEVRSLQQTTGNMALVQNQLRTDVDGVRSDLSSAQQVQDGLVQDVSALGVKTENLEARADSLTEVAADHALELIRLRASEGDAEGMYTHFARADARQVQRMERLQLQADGQQSQIEDIETVQVGHAERIGTVETQTASALSRVQVVETATQTQASRLETVEQQSGDNASRVAQLQSAQDGQASLLADLRTDVDGNTSTAAQLLQTTGELATQQTQLATRVGNAESGLQSVQQTAAGTAQDLTSLTVRTEAAESDITVLRQGQADQASSLVALKTQTDNNTATASQLLQTTGELSAAQTLLRNDVDGVQSGLSAVQTVQAGLVQDVSALGVKTGDLEARADSLTEVAADHALDLLRLRASEGDAEGMYTHFARADARQVQRMERLDLRVDGVVSSYEEVITLTEELSGRQETLTFELNGLSGQVQTLDVAQQGLAGQISTVSARTDVAQQKANAAQAAADQANAAAVQNAADIVAERTARTTAESAQAQTNQQLTASFQQAKTAADAAQGSADQAKTAAAQADARVAEEELARASADAALAQRSTALEAKTETQGTQIQTLDQTTQEQALRQLEMRAMAGDSEGWMLTQQRLTARTARAVEQQAVQFDGMLASIEGIKETIVDETGALAQQINTVSAAATAAGTAAAGAQADADAAQAGVAANIAAIQTLEAATANQFQAQAQEIQTLQATVGDVSASVHETSTALATLDGRIEAWRNVKVQTNVNGVDYIAGTSLGIDGEGNSSFNVLAQSFNVMHNINGTPQAVFSVVGGQMVVRDALIGKISAEKVDAETISAISANLGDITAGTLSGATAGINLNAMGGESFIDVGNGKVVIRANGDSYFDGVVISRPTIMGTGSYALNGLILGHVLGTLGRPDEQIDSRYIYIDTGIDDPYDWAYGHAKPSYTARAKLDGWNEVDAPISGGTQIVLEATACCESVLIGTGANPNQVGRVFLRIGIHLVNGRPGQTRVRLNSLTWAVFKLT